MRRVLRFFTTILVAGLVLSVPVVLAWLYFVGLSPRWNAKVADALGGSAFDVGIARLTFNPFHGIVAEGVTFARKAERGRQLAVVDRLLVSPNLAQLLRGRVAIDRLELLNGSVAFPFADDGVLPDAVIVSGIRAELVSGGGAVTINRAEATVEGLRVVARGQLLLPDPSTMKTPRAPEASASRATLIRSILTVTRRLRFGDPAPVLEVTLSGDLAEPGSLKADPVTLRAGRVAYGDLVFDRVSLKAGYADRVLRLDALQAEGPSGAVRAAGEWQFAANRGWADVSGGLRIAPLLDLAGRSDLARQIRFTSPPAIEAHAEASVVDGRFDGSIVGRTEVGAFELRGIRGKRFQTNFAWRNGRLFLQDAELVSRTGTIRAKVLTGPGELRLSLDSDADPTEFLEIFGPKEQAIIGLLAFKDPPRLTIELTGTRPSLDALAGKGRMVLGRAAMRGSWIDSGEADIEVVDRAIVYRNLVLRKGRQKATGSFTYDFGRREVRLDGIRSNLNPTEVLMWVDPRIASTVAPYRFRGPPDVRADGLTHMADPSKNDLRIAVEASDGLDYELLKRDLRFDRVVAKVNLKGQRILAEVTDARLYDGRVALTADVSIAPDDPTFGVNVTVNGVDFASLTKLYFGYDRSKGAMSGRYAFRASLREPARMRGTGSIRVEDGHVLAIPLFGPLSDVISAILPGGGHESARLATADFTVANQRIATKNLDVKGAGFELIGEGSVGFPSGDMDLAVRINARGIPGLVFFPVSKLLEYVSTGTVSDPQWRPKIIPREFWSVLGLGPGDAEDGADEPPAPKPTRPPPTRR